VYDRAEEIERKWIMNYTENIYYQVEIDGCYIVRRQDGTILIRDLEKNEAYEIIRRWNNHNKLLEACKEAKSQIEWGAKIRGGLGHFKPVHRFLEKTITEAEEE